MKILLFLLFTLSISYSGGNIKKNPAPFVPIVQKKQTFLDTVNKSLFVFIGTSLASVKHNFNDTKDQTDASLGIRFGIQSKSWRTFIDYSADWREYKSLSLETDMLFPSHTILSKQIAPYTGVSIGYFDHKENHNSHAVFGFHGGILVNISKQVDLDIGLSYKRKRKSENLDDSKALSFSLHYFF